MRDFPSIGEYNQTIQNIGGSAFNTLKGINFIPSKTFPIKVYLFGSGAYAVVFKGSINGSLSAIRCFLTVEQETVDRYQQIGNYLQQIHSPWKTNFEFIDNEITIQNKSYPIIRMEWVDGVLINEFVTKHINNYGVLDRIQQQLVEISHDLELNEIGHGDLQCGNIIVTGNESNFQVKLIDYDGMYIPSFYGKKSLEKGRSEFQHPKRTVADFNYQIDRFSFWVMITALEAIKNDKSLWNEVMKGGYNTLDNFLFTVQDFLNPNQSKLFSRLSNIKNDNLQYYINKLKAFCSGNIMSVQLPEYLTSNLPLQTQSQNQFKQNYQTAPLPNFTQPKQENPSIDLLYNEATLKYKRGDFDAALQILEKGLKISPQNDNYLKLISLINLKKDEAKEVENQLQEVSNAIDKRNFEQAQKLIDLLLKKEQKNEYVVLRDKVRNSIANINTAKFDFEKGKNYFDNGDYENATKCFRSSVNLDRTEDREEALAKSLKQLAQNHYDASNEYLKKSRYTEALATIESAIHLEPTNDTFTEFRDKIVRSIANKKKKAMSLKLGAGLIAFIILCTGIFYYGKAADDKNAWQSAIANPSYNAINYYLEKYPQGKYAAIAKDSISKIKERETTEWQSAMFSGNPIYGIESYIKQHPNGAFAKVADSTLDSLYWEVCKKENSRAACEQYLSNPKHLSHIKEVKTMLNEIIQATVTESEKSNYEGIINSFYEHLYSKDFGALMYSLSNTLDVYFNRRNMSKEAVIQSIQGYLNSNHIESERNSIDWSTFNAKHTSDGNTTVKFNMDYYCKIQYPPSENRYNVEVTLTINNDNKISSYNQVVKYNYGATNQ